MQLDYKKNFLNIGSIKYFIFLIIIFLFIKTFLFYDGNKFYYLFFSITFNFTIYRILFKKFYFFEFFLSLLLWLGFWLKFTLFESQIYNSPYIFDGRALCGFNIENFDEVLLVSSVGYLGYIFSLLIVDKFNFFQIQKIKLIKISKEKFFLLIFFLFFIVLFLSTASNFLFGIYQKGISPNQNFFYLSNFFYPYFFNIGFGAAVSYFIYNLHNYNIKFFYIVILIIIVEGFLTNVSMLSRNMILYSTSIFIGYVFFIDNLNQFKLLKKKLFFSFLTILSVFFISIIFTNYLRNESYININSDKIQNENIKCELNFKTNTSKDIAFVNLLLTRPIGLEGIMTTINNKKILSFDLLRKSLSEDKNNQSSFYEKNFLQNQKRTRLYKNSNQVILPGILAYLFFSGSKIFLLFSMFILGLTCISFEKVVIKFTNNIILASFLSFIIVWRLINFGYLVSNTINFILSLIITLIIIYLAQLFVNGNYKKK